MKQLKKFFDSRFFYKLFKNNNKKRILKKIKKSTSNKTFLQKNHFGNFKPIKYF